MRSGRRIGGWQWRYCWLLLGLMALALGISGAKALAADIEPDMQIKIQTEIQTGMVAEIQSDIESDMQGEAGSWWLLRLHLPAGQADSSDNNIVEYRLAAASGGYTLEHPYVPLRLLAEAAGTPLAWVSEGRCAVWGQRECAVVLPLEGRRLFYVLDAGAPEGTRVHEGVYEEEFFEPVFMWQGSLCLPLALLERLGIAWEYSPAEEAAGGELGVIDIYLTAAHGRGVDPELVWQQTRERVLEYQRPRAELLGRGESSFDAGNLGRSQNIYLAAESLHGLVIKAGEEFSFNRAVGPRTAARGFQQAVIFENGRPVMGLGGGICQVSSTLYQAAMRSEGLTVLERHPHSLPVSYAAKGQDATVAWGSLDLRWRNDSGKAVYLLCRVLQGTGEPSRLTVEVWQGEPPQDLPELFSLE